MAQVFLIVLLLLLSGCQSLGKRMQNLAQDEKGWVQDEEPESQPSAILGKPPKRKMAEANLTYATQQFLLKNFHVAEYYLKKTLLQQPDEADALFLYPWSYFFQKRYELALIAFSKVHAQHKRDPHPLIGMGWCYFAMHFYEEALEAFDRAAHFEPEGYQVIKGRAFAYLGLNRTDDAVTELNKIFLEDEVKSLLLQWTLKNQDKLLADLEMVPSSLESATLFTLREEQPRFRSLLYTLEEPTQEPEVEAAWLYYRRGLYNRAVKAFENVDGDLRNSIDTQNGLAWSLFATGRLEESRTVFIEVLRDHPTFEGATLGLTAIETTLQAKADIAKDYYDLNKLRIAELKYEDLKSSYDHWSHPRAMLGTIALAEQRQQDAVSFFADALKRNPDDVVALEGLDQLQSVNAKYLFKGDQALRAGDAKTASYHYWEYIQVRGEEAELDGYLAHAYNGLAWSQLKKGKYSLALRNFERIRHLPEFADDVARGVGLTYFRLGQYRKAYQWLGRAEANEDGREEIAEALDWSVLSLFSPEKAEMYFLKRLKSHPRQASTYLTLGWVYYQGGNPDLGVEYFLKSISLKPELALSMEFLAMLKKERFGWQIYNRMAWEYYHRFENDNARGLFQAALSRKKNSSEALKGLGYLYCREEKFDRARKFLKASLKQNRHPQTVEELLTGGDTTSPVYIETNAHTKLGRVFLETGDFEMALHHFQKAGLEHPNWPEVNDGLGWVYLEMGRLAESRAAFNKAIQYQPLHPLAQKGLRLVKRQQATQSL